MNIPHFFIIITQIADIGLVSTSTNRATERSEHAGANGLNPAGLFVRSHFSAIQQTIKKAFSTPKTA
ncbi:hypothetical protein [Paenibacillus sp. UMB4589-SE434]|uniref:hypothetical protein n=1 Tax=Paenibacillus sp. UMB4589-SE434 TaxID=3046314 RepID=UPI00254A68CE|nr:hypothetical protein [Paenibacillus sp. UMB4589-SE434]